MSTIVSVTVVEPTQHSVRFETASWYEQHTIQPGTYPVEIDYVCGRQVIRGTFDTIRTESYFVNRLFTASSIDHRTDENVATTVRFGKYVDEAERWAQARGFVLNYAD